MKRRGFTWIEALVVVAILGILAAILFPVFQRPHHGEGHRFSCQSNLKQIALGHLQYIQDHDEKFPPIASSGATFGWADSLQPYLKSTQIFQCPSESHVGGQNPRQDSYIDYWFNARLSRVNRAGLRHKAFVIVMGDGNDKTDRTDARYNLSSLPAAWRNDESSPAFRHIIGANYAFADGHVKYVPNARITGAKLDGKSATFQIN